jgi:Spermine/spermidine synthase domain
MSVFPVPGPAARGLALFLVSVLGLFLEMALIRWVGTEVRIFAYLQNTILVACVMGLGMGCMTSTRPARLRDTLLPLWVLVTLLGLPPTRQALGNISQLLSVFGGPHIWGEAPPSEYIFGFLGLALTLILIALIWSMFVPIGRWLGRLLAEDPRPIRAYSINIGGSLIGIWLFVALSATCQGPVVWMAVIVALAVPFLHGTGRDKLIDIALAGSLVLLTWLGGQRTPAIETVWSPYQKLSLHLREPARDAHGAVITGAAKQYEVDVNTTSYQGMFDLRPEAVKGEPRRFPPEMAGLSQYDLPWRLHPNPRKALIVGAGSGNDAAGALRNGVADVVAVEIDPVILDFGRRLHPERPYDHPGVRLVTDDARSYFATCTEKFDVISFGLLDSHTTTAMTNARLDHYVYTLESLRRAKDLLADGGVMVLSFEAKKPWIADRMAGALTEVFGTEPLSFRIPLTGYGWGGVMFVCGDQKVIQGRLAADAHLAGTIREWQAASPVPRTGEARLATDDWPYIYLERPEIPPLYYILAGLLLALLIGFGRALGVPGLAIGRSRANWHFFFLGAAFMLLEVQNVSKAAVVLGNTWEVNAVIISGVLGMILLANAVVGRFPNLPLCPVYVLLVGTCVGLYFIDLAQFAFLPYAVKAAVVGGLTSLPMFFSGIVFIRSFHPVPDKDRALGANLIGSLFGALLQSITFVTGIKLLLLVVAGLYLSAFLTRPREARGG